MTTTNTTATQVEATNTNYLNSFKVTAKVDGKIWLSCGTILTAVNEVEAINKAKNILMLTPEHVINVETCKVYASTAQLKTDSYPYGYQQTTAFFSVEYNNKGSRSIFQTVNPKTGKLNKPKLGTYYSVILPIELSNGYLDFCGHLDFNGTESINRGLHFLNDFKELFTPEQIKNIALTLIAMSKVNIKAMVIYAGSDLETLKPLFEQQVKNLVEIANGQSTAFLSCLFDYNAIEATKKPDYNPFLVKSYTTASN
jgi:hypothetical protein